MKKTSSAIETKINLIIINAGIALILYMLNGNIFFKDIFTSTFFVLNIFFALFNFIMLIVEVVNLKKERCTKHK